MTHHDPSRAMIEITGDNRIHFLQGIVTQDVNLLSDTALLFAAILTPQGKLAHDFFLRKHENDAYSAPQDQLPSGAVLLDTPAIHKDTLIKRLSMYKLRAKVSIRDVSDQWHVAYVTSDGLADPRHPDMPQRWYFQPPAPSPQLPLSTESYHQTRINLGVPDSAFDIMDDTAMDLGYDLLHAISFTKGCYVGQEVTARMHHKNIARRGFYIVKGTAPLPPAGSEIIAGTVKVGTLRGAQNGHGLALLKFEEMAKAEAKNTPLTVGNTPITATTPQWMSPKLVLFRSAQENQ